MDWNKQGQEMVKLWSETQQNMLKQWSESLQGMTQPDTSGVWENTLNIWQQTVATMLNTQAQWARTWAGGVAATKGATKEMIDGATQLKEAVEQWAEFQQELWDGWFVMLRTISSDSTQLTDLPNEVFETWQATLETFVDSQREWMRKWTKND